MITEAYPPMGKSIKMLARQVIEQGKPCNIEFGTVLSSSPLVIRLSQKIKLTDEFLILTNAVKDHSVDVTVSWKTVKDKHQHGNGNNGQPTDEVEHDHAIKGIKKITIHNGLTEGEKVILLRVQGGQSYVVIDRVDEIPVIKGESV